MRNGGTSVGADGCRRVVGAGRRRRVDLEAVGTSFPWGVGEPGHLPWGRARGRGSQSGVGRGYAGGASGGGAWPTRSVGRRLFGGGGVGWDHGGVRAGRWRRDGVGGDVELLRGAFGSTALRVAIA